jgi:hypothetical protein
LFAVASPEIGFLARARSLAFARRCGCYRPARVRALAAYKDFLTLWNDADPDIPILKQAKAEYANYNSRLLAKLRIANVAFMAFACEIALA